MSRGRILQGAIEILDTGVYGDLTVDALARTLHMSKSTLYKYFASKDDVVVSVIEETCAQTDQAIDAFDTDAGDPAWALRQVVEVLALHADRIPRAAVLQYARLPPNSQDRLHLTRAALGQVLQRVLLRGARSGAFRFGDPVLAAATFMAGADAAMQASARGEVEGSRGDAVRALLELFEPGIVRGPIAA